MMRRILPVLLAIMIIFLSACSGKRENEDPTGSSAEPSIKSEEMYDSGRTRVRSSSATISRPA